MSDERPPRERLTLSHDFSEFLVEFSIALHKHGMYPSGHPSLGPAASAVERRAARLLADRELVAFGVARRQLIIEGVATDPSQPVLRRLAETLHEHYLGAVSLSRGVGPDEIGEALRVLAAHPRERPLGLAAADHLPCWPHVRLHPLAFDSLALSGEEVKPADPSTAAAGQRAADLWIGLARAAVTGDRAAAAGESIPTEPAAVAVAINEHPQAEAYDQVIVGYLLQIARELKDTEGNEAAALRRRTGRLIRGLSPETLRRLVEMGGDLAQRQAFVRDAAGGMAVDAVLQVVKAAAEAGGQTISHGLLRMLSKLAAHAEIGRDAIRPLADSALREQVGHLIADWNLADPNPEAYGRVLQDLAAAAPRPARGDGPDAHAEVDEVRLAQMSLELGTTGPLLERAVGRAAARGEAGPLLRLLATMPDHAVPAANAIQAVLSQPATVAALLARTPILFSDLEQLLPFMTTEGFDLLLDALVDSESRPTRRKFLDLLSRPDLEITSLVAARLGDERWFVQRNMLLLLGRAGRLPGGFSARPWTTHPDPRVRHEAFRLQLAQPGEREAAVGAALQDPDARVVALGLDAILADCRPPFVDRVIHIASGTEGPDDVRVLAVRALARSGQPSALDALLRLTDGGTTLLGRRKLPPPSPVLLAAIAGLADAWSADRRAAAVLARAYSSGRPEIQKAARGLVHE